MTGRVSEDSAAAARKMLSALWTADLGALEQALADVPTPGVPPRRSSWEQERWELFESLRDHLRAALLRVHSGAAQRLETLETVISLLAHLARTPPYPLPVPTR